MPANPREAEKSHPFCGRHLLASYRGCRASALRDHAGLLRVLRQAALACGATVLSCAQHRFPNGGLTALLLLAESHASIHTYPEHGACFVDLFTCGDACRAEDFEAVLRKYLHPAAADCRVLLRAEESEEDYFRAA
jgi:S-adenosylmethionine decarboxylase proenzyme